MNTNDVRRLALALSIQAEIEAMKVHNERHKENGFYTSQDFERKARQLRKVATLQDYQVAPAALNGIDSI